MWYPLISISEITTSNGKKLVVQDKNVIMKHIPVKTLLKNLLEINGLFNALTEYMEFLNNDKTAKTNVIQGQLWQKQISTFHKNGIVIPLFGYFDDVETGNSLGSHAENNEVGSVYVMLPSLPPNFTSKFESIVLSDIFYTNDRKQYSNDVIFKRFINKLNDLRENGIELVIEDKNESRTVKEYFITTLILGTTLELIVSLDSHRISRKLAGAEFSV
ncbi:hypothetical protein TSAR_010305 [Trichomalopsis sarcophagae]|uniref:Uncharacterized protein n=1 Tax=Trichomalopsis sarcophagae TaxID=543379 RepID=A0A232EJS0_9HYME|nr:hypothetical protein TSAR_010305 [Trichomalopsis sarcophagae]